MNFNPSEPPLSTRLPRCRWICNEVSLIIGHTVERLNTRKKKTLEFSPGAKNMAICRTNAFEFRDRDFRSLKYG